MMRHTTTHTQATWPSTHDHWRTSGCSIPQRTSLFINDTTGLFLLSDLQEGGSQASPQTEERQASAQWTFTGAYSPFIHSWAFKYPHTKHTLRLLTILGRRKPRGAIGCLRRLYAFILEAQRERKRRRPQLFPARNDPGV